MCYDYCPHDFTFLKIIIFLFSLKKFSIAKFFLKKMRRTHYYIFALLFILNLSTNAQTFRDSIDVLKYNINLDVNIKARIISGTTDVILTPVYDNTKKIILDLQGLNVSQIKIDDKYLKEKTWSQNNNKLCIELNKSLKSKDTVKIEITYSGHPQKDSYWGGFYWGRDYAFNLGVGMDAIPHSFGRIWFPCNDTFTDKAKIETTITVPAGYTATADGILVSHKGNTFHYKLDKEIPVYLASVAVADYSVWKNSYTSVSGKKIPVEVYYLNDRTQNPGQSLTHLNDVLRIFEQKFGAYQWDLVRYSSISFNGGAMEHAENISMPSMALTGTLSQETLLYHELSHHWFGDLVTCANSYDMWLNEGWASYCEAIMKQDLYGEQAFRDYNRMRHFKVIYLAHVYDNGYKPVANIDLQHTYGTTVYKKGADVLHTLRYYIGDSLFFPAVRKYLQTFAWKNATTEDFKNSLEQNAGINLDDFFDFWLYSASLPFFEITDVKNKDNQTIVTVNQRVVGDTVLAKSNRLEIFFIDSTLKKHKRIFEFSGEQGTDTFNLGFTPAQVCLDLDEHTADLTLDRYYIVKDTGTYIFDESFFDAVVTNVTDSAFLRVSANCIEPEHLQNNDYLFQQNYYWTVEGVWNDDFKAYGKFYFTRLMDLNFTKLHRTSEIKLLYRPASNSKWQEINYEFKKDYLWAPLKKGQYCFAIKY